MPLASKTSVSFAAPTGVSRSGPASTTGAALTSTRAASVPTAQAEPLSSVTESSTSRAPGVSKVRSTCGPSSTTPSLKRQRQPVILPSRSAERPASKATLSPGQTTRSGPASAVGARLTRT